MSGKLPAGLFPAPQTIVVLVHRPRSCYFAMHHKTGRQLSMANHQKLYQWRALPYLSPPSLNVHSSRQILFFQEHASTSQDGWGKLQKENNVPSIAQVNISVLSIESFQLEKSSKILYSNLNLTTHRILSFPCKGRLWFKEEEKKKCFPSDRESQYQQLLKKAVEHRDIFQFKYRKLWLSVSYRKQADDPSTKRMFSLEAGRSFCTRNSVTTFKNCNLQINFHHAMLAHKLIN